MNAGTTSLRSGLGAMNVRTTVTVMAASDWLAPSAKVYGVGVVTPEVASLAT